ncbi:MAG: hypothetical protein ACRDRJ_16375 [Streptosporangiaceae bacterium]
MALYLGDAGPVGTRFTTVSAGQADLDHRRLRRIRRAARRRRRLGHPGTIAALTPPGTHPEAQLLYTFTKASNALQIAADVSALRAALPAGAVVSKARTGFRPA